jgi:hypothetical protein
LTQPEVVCGNSLQPDSHPVGVTMGVTVPSGFPKQAIVVIHGMGEQKPMDTIKNFAHAVWTADSEVHKNGLRDSGEIWSKPDDRTGSLELRRLTTRESTPICREDRRWAMSRTGSGCCCCAIRLRACRAA